MTRDEHLLTCLGEEATEIAQNVTKALRFSLTRIEPGQPLTNAERIAEEINDLFAVAALLIAEGKLPDWALLNSPEKVQAKIARIKKSFAISRATGTLVEPEHA